MQQPHGPLRSFGRLKSRPIKPRQAELLDTLLPRLAINLAAADDQVEGLGHGVGV